LSVGADSAAPADVLELAAARALPARTRVVDDGWWLRADDGGVVRRANAVFAGAAGVDPPEEKIRRAEAWYRERGSPVRFQLSPASAPAGLETALRERGYRFETPVLVMERRLVGRTASASEPAGADGAPGAVRLMAAADADWIRAYTADLPPAEAGPRRRLALAAPLPRCYAGVDDLACGLAGVDGDRIGLFDLATAPTARRRGHAARISAALLGWGADHGARRAYLQVAEANAAGRALYERMGFLPAYRYVYAVRDLQ